MGKDNLDWRSIKDEYRQKGFEEFFSGFLSKFVAL